MLLMETYCCITVGMQKKYVKCAVPTPNPSTYKWIINESFAGDDMYEFSSASQANDSDLAKAIWSLNDHHNRIDRIFFHDNMVVLSKNTDVNWSDDFINEITHHIEKYFITHNKLPDKNAENLSDTEKLITEVIRDYIQPAVSNHGGYIKFQYFQDGIVYLSMHGACDGCASASITLHSGVENILKFYVPGVNAIELVK